MIVHRGDMKTETREKPRGGNGTASFVHFVEGKGAFHKNTNLLAELTLPPGSSFGDHAHDSDTEYFIILEGSGMVNDNGTRKPIAKGDVMITGNGETHSIENTGTVPMVLHAVIVKD